MPNPRTARDTKTPILEPSNTKGKKNNSNKVKDIIFELCQFKEYSGKQIAVILSRNENYVYRNYINPMREERRLHYTIPDMPNHPNQAYKSL